MSLRATIANTAPPKGGAHGGIIDQPVAHQFEDIDQQNESYIVGMWTFLVTEIMFFGALFLAYSIYRTLYPATYLDCHRFLSIQAGTLNTGILLFSSWSMVMAVVANQHGKKWPMIIWLSVVILCSLVFLGVKYTEYDSKIKEGLWVGNFNYAKANTEWIEHEKSQGEQPEALVLAEAAQPGDDVVPGKDVVTAKLYHHEAKRVFPYYPTVQELAAGYRYTDTSYANVEKTD
ncbi:MAG: hypothetical protein EOO39_43265, partial [Cytophagaceae bacterium]